MREVKIIIEMEDNINIDFGKNKRLSGDVYEIGISKPGGVTTSSTRVMELLDKVFGLYIGDEEEDYDTSGIARLLQHHLDKVGYVNEVIKFDPPKARPLT